MEALEFAGHKLRLADLLAEQLESFTIIRALGAS